MLSIRLPWSCTEQVHIELGFPTSNNNDTPSGGQSLRNPLTPIPPLQVPPVTSQRPVAQSSSEGGAAAEKGSEVPQNWKPPHAELNNAAAGAVAVARQSETGVGTPTPGPDGRVLYVFGQGMPVMVCAPLRVCAVELQPGELLQSQPQIGDSRRWEITPDMSGSGLDQTPLLVVKPIEPGLETDLIIPTDRRTYVGRLVSDPTRFVSRLAFQYAADDRAKWETFQAQQDAGEARRRCGHGAAESAGAAANLP
jgi:type IV secretory pathway VirB9-like protein